MFSSLAGQTLFIALFGAAIRAEFGLSDGQYGLIYTAATLCSAICLIWAGTLPDRLPAAVLAGGIAAGLTIMCLTISFAPSVLVLGIALFGLRFFGQGMTTHNAATAISRWFNRFRGRALAISQLGLNTGEAILPVLVAFGIAAIGWRSVWLVAAAVVALVLAPAIVFLFANPPDGKRARAAGFTNPDAASTEHTGSQWTRRKVLADPVFWPVLIGLLAMPAISTAIFFHQTNLVADKGWGLLTFAAFFPVMSVTSVISSMASGWLIDRFGAYRLLPFLLLPAALSHLLIWQFSAFWVIPAFFLLNGFTNGANGTIMNAMWAELYGTRHLGSVRAIATSAMVLSSAVGPGIVGVFIDQGVSVAAQGPFFAGYCIAASIVFFTLQGRLEMRKEALYAPSL
ncbi:MFS transporter [Pelagibacterium xiamenense]|uniref:MFS transporter n=1 Tax=Pelagibacterium xiamenense TaxID=2901140 RepID=UPI001E2A5F4C|nr:MFS transporter [Pelagibacterium xiamenense]MCD7058598.1 MFS transporter [Pelagibacterium xiamenense]